MNRTEERCLACLFGKSIPQSPRNINTRLKLAILRIAKFMMVL